MSEELKDIKASVIRVEEKLDKYLETTYAHKADIDWIKGFIKTSTSIVIAIVTALVGFFIKHK